MKPAKCLSSAASCIVAAGLVLAATSANATQINHPNFNDTSGLTLQGDTTTTGSPARLRLVSATRTQHGAAYSTHPVDLGPGATFSTTFQFQMTDAGGIDPADGLTFVLASDATGLGGIGGGLGYQHVNNSFAIEFDTYDNSFDPDSNHVGLDANGDLRSLASASPYGVATCTGGNGSGSYTADGCMANGHVWTALITYGGSQNLLNVSVGDPAENGSSTMFSDYLIDIGSYLGTNSAYVGFTGGTGDGYQNEDILNWRFSNTADLPPVTSVPEPGGLTLFALGLIGIAWLARRRRRA